MALLNGVAVALFAIERVAPALASRPNVGVPAEVAATTGASASLTEFPDPSV
ncbi:MAG TPA: hypothetical protein VMZ30_02100 [Pyrinomonadaceae bacterium]|nr:hypothetical protein [Pyrinomonadaceae bacterium]